VKPKTDKLQSHFVQLIAQESAEAGHVAVGKVTHFITYSWFYPYRELLAIMKNYLVEQHRKKQWKRVFFFVDILAINQWRPNDPTELPLLEKVVETSDKLLACMFPWDRPVIMTRVWCLYEMFTALNADTTLNMCFSADEGAKFIHALRNDQVGFIDEQIRSIDVQECNASVASDKVMILDKIEKACGFEDFNTQLRSYFTDGLVKLMFD